MVPIAALLRSLIISSPVIPGRVGGSCGSSRPVAQGAPARRHHCHRYCQPILGPDMEVRGREGDRRQETEDRKTETEDRRQKTEDRRQKTGGSQQRRPSRHARQTRRLGEPLRRLLSSVGTSYLLSPNSCLLPPVFCLLTLTPDSVVSPDSVNFIWHPNTRRDTPLACLIRRPRRRSCRARST